MDETSIEIVARPEDVWALVTDLEGMGRWSPENSGGSWKTGDAATLGSVFVGSNRHGLVRWRTHCMVVTSDPNRHFAFEVAESKTRWSFVLEPGTGITTLTERREKIATQAWYVRLFSGSGLIGRNRDERMLSGMKQTLGNIKDALEAG